MKIRISRPCYDKYHRCPGWNGGGPHYAKKDKCGYSGRIEVDYDDKWWKWKFWPCSGCNTVVLPYHAQKLSPWHWVYEAKWKYRDWQYDRRRR